MKHLRHNLPICLFALFAALVGNLAIQNEAGAYYKKDHNQACFAIAYTYKIDPQGDKTIEQGTAKATDQICATLNEDGTVKGEIKLVERTPDGYDSLGFDVPQFQAVENNTVHLIYSETFGMPTFFGVTTTTFNYTGGSFYDFVSKIQNFVAGKKTAASYKIQGISSNADKKKVKEEVEDDREEAQTEKELDAACRKLSSLGWLLCSVYNDMTDAAEDIYNNFLANALALEPQLLKQDSDTRTAWTTFQSIANVVLIILLMIIILSQLTGVGINNYGIKKALPKLIVAAILINLSFIVCQLAVDISNILGSSLKGFFDAMPPSIDSITVQDNSTIKVGDVLTAVGILAGIGAIASGLLTIGVLLTLLVSGLSVLIAFLFLFILLATRQIITIVLIVVSPVAIACYILPNTKAVFDKWLKIFKTMLLLYPACGLLIGAGDFVSRLSLCAGMGTELWGSIVAMLAGVVPIFFIPSLVKNSMSALGSIGAKFAGLGTAMGRGASGRIRRSEGFNRAQTHLNAVDAGGIRHRLAGTKFGRRVGIQRNLARSTQAVDNLREQDSAAALILGRSDYADKGEEAILRDWNAAFESGNTEKLTMLTNLGYERGGKKFAGQVGEMLDLKQNVAGNRNYQKSLGALQGNMRNNPNFSKAMFDKAGGAAVMMSSGGRKADGSFGNLNEFENPANKVTDFSTQSLAELMRDYKNGKLKPDMAGKILDSDDPSVKSGILSDDESRSFLELVRANNGAGIDNEINKRREKLINKLNPS